MSALAGASQVTADGMTYALDLPPEVLLPRCGRIYVIRELHDPSTPYVKVGLTVIGESPGGRLENDEECKKRLSGLRSGNPRKLAVAKLSVPMEYSTAQDAEYRAHGLLNAEWVLGEWFKTTPDHAYKVVKEAIACIMSGEPYKRITPRNRSSNAYKAHATRKQQAALLHGPSDTLF